MGWLELLPLLKRALPLLDRLAPMLEATLAGRGAARAGLELTASTTAEMARSQSEIMQALLAQETQISALSKDVKRLYGTEEFIAKQMQALEEQVRLLKTLCIVGLVLLLVTVGLLLAILSHHA